MTALDRVTRLAWIPAALFGAGVLLGAAACSSPPEEPANGGGTEESPAAEGGYPEQLRLTEGQPLPIGPHEDTQEGTVVLLTGFEDSGDPVAVIEVGEGQVERRSLELGESMGIAGEDWRLSEIAVSDTEGLPGSATLVRGVPEGADPDLHEDGEL